MNKNATSIDNRVENETTNCKYGYHKKRSKKRGKLLLMNSKEAKNYCTYS